MTNTTHTDTQQAVAVLGLPELARALTDAGLRVVTGENFRTAAAATNAQLRERPVPLVFADVAIAGITPWVEKVLRSCRAVLLGVDLADGQKRIGGNTTAATRMAAPAAVDDILTAVGLSGLATGLVLAADGSVSFSGASTPAVAVPDEAAAVLDQLESMAAMGLQAPVAPAPLPATPVQMDPPTPAAVAVAPQAVVPVVPTQHSAPPLPQVPADFWSVLPPAPAAVAPVAPPTAPVQVPGFDLWDEAPAIPPLPDPVVAPTPAPVCQAPVVPAAEADDFFMTAQVDAPPPPVPPMPVAPPTPVAASHEWAAQFPVHAVIREPAPVVVAEQIGVETGYSTALGRRLAPVILSLAGKGGVGKTSIALALAQRAAVIGQMRTVLVDGNRGQGDLRTYLSLNRSGLPTIYDALTTRDPSKAIVTPGRLNANRSPDAEQLAIALVQAPPRGLTDTSVITAGLYHDVITAARGVSDLVVVDTQIVEGAERGMFDDLFIPMLASHAFGLGIADLSSPGVDNLIAHLGEFISQGVPVERLMTMLNRVPATTQYDLQRTSGALSRYGVFLAAVPADPEVHASMAYGTSIQDNPVLAPVLDQVLMRVTGNPIFAQQIQARAAAGTDEDGARKRRRWGRK